MKIEREKKWDKTLKRFFNSFIDEKRRRRRWMETDMSQFLSVYYYYRWLLEKKKKEGTLKESERFLRVVEI